MAGSRGPRGRGTIYRRKDGRFEGAAFLPTASGRVRRIHVYGHSRVEAHAKLNTRLEQAQQGIPEPDTSWTLAEYLSEWLRTHVAHQTRPLTAQSYESLVRRYLVPLLGTKRLTNLSVSDVQSAINTLMNDGHSARTIQKVRSVLRSALSTAMRRELVFRNVAKLVEIPRWDRKPIEPWSAEEVHDFLTAAEEHIWFIGFLMLLTYGMREGEVLGLRWSDIDFDRDLIHIRQQIQRVDGKLRAVPVKTTAAQRTLPLVPRVRIEFIKLARQRGIDLDLEHTPATPTEMSTDALIVTSLTLGPVEAQNFLRAFRTLVKHAGVRPITIHHTRHTVATLLATLGVPARDAQLILGHSNVTTTQQIYQHGNREQQREAIAAIEKAISDTVHDERKMRLAGRDPADQSDVSRQVKPSKHRIAIDSSGKQIPLLGDPTGANATNDLGGSSQTRTGDTRLFSSISALFQSLPSSVIRDMHTRTKRRILGRLAVKLSRQTVAPIVLSNRSIDDLLATCKACRSALTEQMRRRSFPYSLLSTTSHQEEVK